MNRLDSSLFRAPDSKTTSSTPTLHPSSSHTNTSPYQQPNQPIAVMDPSPKPNCDENATAEFEFEQFRNIHNILEHLLPMQPVLPQSVDSIYLPDHHRVTVPLHIADKNATELTRVGSGNKAKKAFLGSRDTGGLLYDLRTFIGHLSFLFDFLHQLLVRENDESELRRFTRLQEDCWGALGHILLKAENTMAQYGDVFDAYKTLKQEATLSAKEMMKEIDALKSTFVSSRLL